MVVSGSDLVPLHEEEKGCDADAEEADRCRDHQRHLQRGQVTTRRRGAPDDAAAAPETELDSAGASSVFTDGCKSMLQKS